MQITGVPGILHVQNSKAAFCGKTFGKASHVSIVFSSTALLCKAKREKAAFFFFFKVSYTCIVI